MGAHVRFKWKKDLASATAHAIANLQGHASAGCLSKVPPGHGTNRNARFHCLLSSFFNKSKIGVLVAYALMTVFIYVHNLQVLLKNNYSH